MKIPRRQFLHLAAGAAALPLASRVSVAQTYPNRYMRLVVPFPPGGAADPIARILANRLSEMWGQQVVIENKGGAGGNIGAQAVVQSTPDGYTLFMGSIFLATNPYLYRSLGYDPIAGLAPVAMLCSFPNLMVVPNSSPAKSVAQFIDYARANRGKITFGSSGIGSSIHLSGELFKRLAGIEMTHVPYRGGGPAMNDLIPGRIDVYFGNLPGMLPQVQSGAVRGLAVTSAARVPFAFEFPTVAESGLPRFEVSAWFALFMPANTPFEFVSKVHDDAVAALAHPAVKQKLTELGVVVTTSTPAGLATLLKSEMEKWGSIIKDAGIKPE